MYLNEISADKTFCKHVNIKSVYATKNLKATESVANKCGLFDKEY